MTRRKRSLIGLIATVLAVIGAAMVVDSPAMASTTSCQHGGGYSWDSTSWSLSNVHHVEIDVYNSATSCAGNYILAGTVETQGNNLYNPASQDNSCDNKGMTLFFHLTNGSYYSLATTGCGTTHNGTEVAISSVGPSKTFWLYINNTVNTTAYALPVGP